MTSKKKIAVFSTSDIQRLRYEGNVLVPMSPEEATTGKLEKAISEGFTIYVVSTRTKLSETDEWWQKLVPNERIFLASENDDGGYANSESTIAPWEELYEKVLGIKPAPLDIADYDRAEELGVRASASFQPAFETWLDAQDQLESHGIRKGSSF